MANKYALLIGNSEYHDERLARLKTPATDVEILAGLLGDQNIGGYQVKVLLNQPFSTVLKEIVSFLKDRHRDDHLLLYFSGHGVLDEGGNLYLATKDTERDLLSATALSNRFIKDEMDRSRSKRQVLILDCCHSGAFLKGTKGAGPALTQATFEGYGRAVLTAADSVQYALEGDQVDEGLELSLFTHFLVEGIQTGEADRGNDGWIELDEWFDYAFRKVRDRTERQTPRKFIDNQYGELYIARNPNASMIKPVELPEKLRARMKSEYKPDRLEAIQELGGLLDSDDPSMAATAQIALEKISVEDDSLSIRNNAAELLRQSTVRQESRKVEVARRALQQAEAERLAVLKAEEERQAREKVEAERLAALKAEEKRLARERDEAERQAALKVEAERKQAEIERLARQSAEQDERQRQARVKARVEPFGHQPVEAGSQAEAVSVLEQPSDEEIGTQAPRVRKFIDSMPRWAIWIGLSLVGALIVGILASRLVKPAGPAAPATTQMAAAASPPIQLTSISPGSILHTDTPPPPFSTESILLLTDFEELSLSNAGVVTPFTPLASALPSPFGYSTHPEFTMWEVDNRSRSGDIAINVIPQGNPNTDLATTATTSISSALLGGFRVADYDVATLEFWINTTSNPRIRSIHNCDSALEIYFSYDSNVWEHMTALCGEHKTETQGWRQVTLDFDVGDAAIIYFGFEYTLQNNPASDPNAYFLIDDLTITAR